MVVPLEKIQNAEVLLLQLNDSFLDFTIPPDSSIPLPSPHIYIYTSEHSVILVVQRQGTRHKKCQTRQDYDMLDFLLGCRGPSVMQHHCP